MKACYRFSNSETYKNTDLNNVTWNANNVKYKINELRSQINWFKFNLIGICENKLAANYKMKILGYSVYTGDKNSHGSGVALIIKNSIRHDIINLLTLENTEAVATNIETSNGTIILYKHIIQSAKCANM